MALLAALAIGMLYGSTPLSQAFEFWTKYLKLLVVPIIIALAPNEKLKRLAINLALGAVTLSVLVSYIRYLGFLPPYSDPNQAYIGFQNRITFGLYTSVASYVFAYRAIKLKEPRWRIFYSILFFIFAYNTLAINNGRTGYVIFFALTALFIFRNIPARLKLASLGIALIAIAATLLTSPVSRDRLERSVSNVETLQTNKPVADSSIVIRWQFFKNSLSIIQDAPLIGHGTGSFENQYEKRISGSAQVGSSNPHNDYLLIASQLGFIGLTLEFLLIASIAFSIGAIKNEDKEVIYALIISFILYSGLNSTLLDAGEGRYFLILFSIIISSSKGVAFDAKR
jgi:O-antigen ligase